MFEPFTGRILEKERVFRMWLLSQAKQMNIEIDDLVCRVSRRGYLVCFSDVLSNIDDEIETEKISSLGLAKIKVEKLESGVKFVAWVKL